MITHMGTRAKSLTVVSGRNHYLLASLLVAMIGKSLNTNQFNEASYVVLAVSLFILGLRRTTRFQPQIGRYDIGYRVFGLPLWIRRYELEDITAVRVKHRIIKNDSDRAEHRYVVSLIREPAQNVAMLRSDALKARKLGEKIAKHIQRQLIDGSHGVVVRRTDEELDMSLGERLCHRGKEIAYPTPPAKSRIEILSPGNEIHLRLPGQPLWGLIVALLILVFALFAGLSFLAEPSFQILMLIFSATCTSVVILAAINSKQPTDMWVTPDSVRYRKFPFSNNISMCELEEVLSKGSDLTLISDRKIMGIPYDFNREEGRYVRKLIEYMAARSHRLRH